MVVPLCVMLIGIGKKISYLRTFQDHVIFVIARLGNVIHVFVIVISSNVIPIFVMESLGNVIQEGDELKDINLSIQHNMRFLQTTHQQALTKHMKKEIV